MAQVVLDVVYDVKGLTALKQSQQALNSAAKSTKTAESAFQRASNSVKTFGRNSQSATGYTQKLGNAARKAGTDATGMGKAIQFASNAFKAFIGFQIGKTFLNAAASMEKTQTQLKTLTGSASQADKIFKEILAVSKEAPFSFEELTGAAAKLKAFGVSTQDVVKTTTQLGKVAAATGQQIDGIALAYGQVLAKGRLQGEELLQFQERGIPLAKELQKELGVTGVAFQKMVEGGKISSQQVIEAFNRMTGANGQFNTAFENTANLLSTKLTNLQSSLTLFASAFTQAFGPLIKTALDGATSLVEKLTHAILLSADAGKLTEQELQGVREQARAIAESKVDQPWLNAAEASRIYNEELNKGIRKLIDQKLAAGEITNAAYDDLMAQKEKNAAMDLALTKKQEEARINKEITALNQQNATAASMETTAISQRLAVQQALVNAEKEINSAKLQSAEADLQAAETDEERAKAARKIYEINQANAELQYDATVAAANAELQKVAAALKHAEILQRQVQAQVALQQAQGLYNDAQNRALTAAQQGVQIAEGQLNAQQQITAAIIRGAGATREKQLEAAKVTMEMQMQTQQQSQTNAAIEQGASAMSRLANEAERARAASSGISGGGGGGGGGTKTFTSTYRWKNIEKYKLDPEGNIVEKTDAELKRDYNQIRLGGWVGDIRYTEQGRRGGSARAFAEGGYVTGPTNAIIGEGNEPEYVIPQSKMDGAMQRYGSGMRGSSVIPDSANVSVNYNGSTVDMGGTSYINKGDVNGIVSQAVNQTLTTLQRSAGARLKAGMR